MLSTLEQVRFLLPHLWSEEIDFINLIVQQESVQEYIALLESVCQEN
jgi:hypothetical protein